MDADAHDRVGDEDGRNADRRAGLRHELTDDSVEDFERIPLRDVPAS